MGGHKGAAAHRGKAALGVFMQLKVKNQANKTQVMKNQHVKRKQGTKGQDTKNHSYKKCWTIAH